MVYTISENVERMVELQQQIMDAKFHRIQTDDVDDKNAKTNGRHGLRKGSETRSPDIGIHETRRIWKNVLVIGTAFMIHFTAFWGASNLQSSVNSEAALGTFTLAAIYLSLLLSNIFLPVIVIKWLGAKWTIAFSILVYTPFIMAQFYPRFYTMIPAGLMIGFGGGPLWCAKCTYLTVVAEAYSKLTGIGSDVIVTRFFGVFFMFYSMSQVWGNLISSAVLSSGSPTEGFSNITSINITSILNNDIPVDFYANAGDRCGANFCPGSAVAATNPNLVPPSTSKINLIAGIYLACMVFAFLIIAFGIDKMSRYDKDRKGSGGEKTGCKLLAVTLKQLGKPKQLLILPITMFIGAEQAFIAADYTAAFVSCGWGISNIGFVMICFGACNGIASIFSGSIVKHTGRTPVICFALCLHTALIVTMLIWRPSPEGKLVFFIISGLWGICDALWLVQINSLSGLLFPGKEEAAYSNFRLWESLGSVITYSYNPYLCTNTKLYLLIGLLIVGCLGYTGVEYVQYKERMEEEVIAEKSKFELISDALKSGEVAD